MSWLLYQCCDVLMPMHWVDGMHGHSWLEQAPCCCIYVKSARLHCPQSQHMSQP
jgi:hypothetical protein